MSTVWYVIANAYELPMIIAFVVQRLLFVIVLIFSIENPGKKVDQTLIRKA